MQWYYLVNSIDRQRRNEIQRSYGEFMTVGCLIRQGTIFDRVWWLDFLCTARLALKEINGS